MRRGDDGGKPTTKLHHMEIAGLAADSVPPISEFTKPDVEIEHVVELPARLPHSSSRLRRPSLAVRIAMTPIHLRKRRDALQPETIAPPNRMRIVALAITLALVGATALIILR